MYQNKIIVALIVLLIMIGSASAIGSVSPTLYWKFNEDSGNANNSIAGGFNLTNTNTYTPGKLGNAIQLDVNEQATASNTNQTTFYTNNFTIALWFKASNQDRTVAILQDNSWINPGAWGAYYSNGLGTGQGTQFPIALNDVANGADYYTTPNLATGSWHRLIYIREGTGANQLKVYVDGVNTANYTAPHNISISNGIFTIAGGAPTGTSSTLYYDDFRIYNGYAWTKSDVTTDWNGGSGQEWSPTVGYMNVNQLYPGDNSSVSSEYIAFLGNYSTNSFNFTNATYFIWYQNGSIFNQTTKIVTGNATNTSSLNVTGFTPGRYTWNIYLCGVNTTTTLCKFADSNYTFVSGFSLDSPIYNVNVSTTSTQTFSITGTKTSQISSVTAKLWYNGTSYTSVVSTTSTTFNLSNIIDIPQGLTGSISFYWEISYFGTFGGFSQNTSLYYQNVSRILLYECSSPTGLTLNFTTYDSQNNTRLNSTLEATFVYYVYGGSGETYETLNFQDLNMNKSNWMFCLNSTGQNASINAFISYIANGYDRREYIIEDGIVGNFTQNIPLYLASTSETDVVTITVKDQNYNVLQGYLISVQEWVIGTDTFKSIGMFTTNNGGQGIMNLELYNVWYRAVVAHNGNIVEVTEVQKLADTSWEITVNLDVENPYTLFDSISHGLTYDNSTNISTFTWLDNSGYVQQGCLYIRNSTSVGYITISTECLTSVSGTINYQLSGSGEYEIIGVIYLISDYNVSKIVDVDHQRLGTPELATKVSPFGKVISTLFTGTMLAIGISQGNPYLAGILSLLSVIVEGKLGWLNITESIIWGIVSILVIIIFRINKK